MTFNEYQESASKTAVYPNIGNNPIYPAFGVAGETGEIMERIKIVLRNHDGVFSEESVEGIKGDIGDVLWYLSQLSKELGISFDDAAQHNIDKLKSRQKRGVLKTEGVNK